MMVAVVKRTCMRDRIRDELVARILDGSYPPGTQLKELSLAREFNVSQAPIREALRELEGTGLVSSERYRGTWVRGTDLEEMRQSYELRAMMEARSVQRGLPFSEAIFQQLDLHFTTMTAAAARNDSRDYIDAALAFHRALVEAGGNATFLRTWDALHWDVRGRIALQRLFDRGENLAPLLQMHGDLLQKLRAQDVDAACVMVEAILQQVAQVFSGS